MSDRANVKIIPPLIPMIGLAMGTAVHWLTPLSIGSGPIVRVAGAILMVASVALVLTAASSLAQAETAFDVRRSTTRIVRTGAYRFSRNPVYLASILLCWGIGLATNALFVALAAIPSASALCLLVIRKEETYLLPKFGGEYAAYRASVRRWL